MNIENLWISPDYNIHDQFTDNIKRILSEQSEYLKKNTDGTVFGKFRVIKEVNHIPSTVDIASLLKSEVDDEDTKGLANADDLYDEKRYCYEIYNKTYKYRPFEMHLSPIYPILLIPDGGIWEDEENELKKVALCTDSTKNEVQIDSDEMLVDVLKVIFRSKRVQYIVSRLKELSLSQKSQS